ncbi:MAG: nucleoside deaminase [Desulfovibrionales bacterium]
MVELLAPPDHPPGAFSSWEEVMELALVEAKLAATRGEVPVGAVLLDAGGAVVSAACNQPIGKNDPTGHAEIRALRRAARRIGNYRLPGTVLVVTLEPCLMCLGALIHARVAGLVFAAADPKSGAVRSRLNGAELQWTNHTFWTLEGVLAGRSSALLQSFFRARRQRQNLQQPLENKG